jgi:hypothetical protein
MQIKQEIHEEIESYIRAHTVGRMGGQRLLEECHALIREAYARMLGVEERRIEIVNLRFEPDGKTLAWDGIRLLV